MPKNDTENRDFSPFLGHSQSEPIGPTHYLKAPAYSTGQTLNRIKFGCVYLQNCRCDGPLKNYKIAKNP